MSGDPVEQYENEWQKELSQKSYDLEKEVEHNVELLDDITNLMKERDDLRRQLEIAREGLEKYADDNNWNEYSYYDGEYSGGQIARNALAAMDKKGE